LAEVTLSLCSLATLTDPAVIVPPLISDAPTAVAAARPRHDAEHQSEDTGRSFRATVV
jgi:hypothetical protein